MKKGDVQNNSEMTRKRWRRRQRVLEESYIGPLTVVFPFLLCLMQWLPSWKNGSDYTTHEYCTVHVKKKKKLKHQPSKTILCSAHRLLQLHTWSSPCLKCLLISSLLEGIINMKTTNCCYHFYRPRWLSRIQRPSRGQRQQGESGV